MTEGSTYYEELASGYDGRGKRAKKLPKGVAVGKDIKRARGAYSFFYEEYFPQTWKSLKKSMTSPKVTDAAKILAAKWHKLSPTIKRKFILLAEKDKKRAERER